MPINAHWPIASSMYTILGDATQPPSIDNSNCV